MDQANEKAERKKQKQIEAERAVRKVLDRDFKYIGELCIDNPRISALATEALPLYRELRLIAKADYARRSRFCRKKLAFYYPTPHGGTVRIRYVMTRYSGIQLVPPKKHKAARLALGLDCSLKTPDIKAEKATV
ncbi:hypothetical protein GO003_002775 [Methylicorpusculum oleiharenae]|uniref:hypothetical protein n=1 Tax=Methylicorpusculum oleiharenae TaxID=1338687 RepID=UPI0013586593|nr:hypothetical protein [Methylicorpusculum oleiharenae]MCD2449312.1 hypothetical protein [Methylicorpusculum oleiharenae]